MKFYLLSSPRQVLLGVQTSLAFASLVGLPTLAGAASTTVHSGLFTVDTRGRLFAEWAVAAGVPAGTLTGLHGPAGVPLLVAYALGWSLPGATRFTARLPRWATGEQPGVVFELPTAGALDLRLIVEESGNLNEWIEIGRCVRGGPWTGTAVVTETVWPEGFKSVRVVRPAVADEKNRWFRLRVEAL